MIEITIHQKIFSLLISAGILFFVLDLVRRRKLKEEYSFVWLLVSVALIVLVVWPDLLLFLSHLIGAETPLTTIYIFGFLFLFLVNLDYSIKISKQKDQIKKLAQKIGILSKELNDFKKDKK